MLEFVFIPYCAVDLFQLILYLFNLDPRYGCSRNESLDCYLQISIYIVRRLELNYGNLVLNEHKIERFREITVMPIGTSGKADIDRRYVGRKVYTITTKNPGIVQEKDKR